MSEMNVLAIADMDAEDREKHMGGLFEQLGGLEPQAQKEALRTLIQEMAKNASDSQYHRLCATNLKLAAAMPDDQLKPFLSLRMQASQSLGEPYATRDLTLVQAAIQEAPSQVREKITRNM